MLIVLAGLPGSGKSAVANELALVLAGTLVAVDPLEAAILRAGIGDDRPVGLAAYVAAEAVARGQLALGGTVVVDAVNDDPRARQQWRDLASSCGAELHWVEVRCGDAVEHRRRLESRTRDLAPLPEPTWASVERRRAGFDDWSDARIVVDTMAPLERCVRTIVAILRPDGDGRG